MSMYIILTIFMLFAGGLIACYGLIIAQAPDIKEKFDLVIPFQGVIGGILLILGLRELLRIGLIISLIQAAPFWGILGLAVMITEFVLGFILAYGLITQLITSNQQAAEKINSAYNSLVFVQVPFGLIAIFVAFVLLIANVISSF